MADALAVPGAGKLKSRLFILFLPSVDRERKAIDQQFWRRETLLFLGKTFGGATAYPKGEGVWRDDEQGGALIFDEPVAIHCYTDTQTLEQNLVGLTDFLVRLGREAHQGAVGFVIDNSYMEIAFPAKEADHGQEH